ncbi:MAG: hypothetical protein O2955_06895 [Planctomycetota bacterium]|nr:hypothetical protein [Planctomycetota bacterium]MDA1212223.1 hypothetical protein [Planctomycetota bacterium]
MSSILHRGILAFGLIFLISACGQSGDESKTTTAGTDVAKGKVDPPVTAAPSDEAGSSGEQNATAEIESDEPDDVTTASAEEMADDEDSDNPFVPPSPDRIDENKPKAPLEKRPELTGRWFAVMSNGGGDLYLWLLEVVVTDDASAPDGKKRDLKVVASLPEMESNSTLEVRELTKTSASFAFTFSEGDEGAELKLDFEGTLQDGIVYGNLLIPGGDTNTMRLIPTKEKNLKAHNKPDETPPGRKVLQKVVESEDPVRAMRDFCQKYNQSPISLEVYKQLIASSKESNLEADVVKEIYGEYVENAKRWGSRMEFDARLEGAILLAFTGNLPEYAIEVFDEIENSVPAGMEDIKSKIEMGRDRANVEIAMHDLESDDAEVQQAAYDKLQGFHDKNPFDPNLTFTLAKQMEKSGKVDDAIALYAELASLPMLENFLQIDPAKQQAMPSETLEKLWNEKHGNTDGLEAYLDEVYGKRIHSFVKAPEDSTLNGNRVQLVELFTGAECPPCVAADVATGGLEVAFSPSDLLVIRYHQHIPGPDPLSNEDSEARFNYYPIRGTPAAFLDGKPVEGVGGYLPQTLSGYNRLKEEIVKKLGDASEITIDLKASGTAPDFSVSANVGGLPAEVGDLRLRIVLAEKEVHFLAGNGIRFHEMVVRAMLGGAEGIAVTADKPDVQQSINVDELKTRLGNYLKAFEEGQDVEFSDKPLDLNNLQIVAFVQSDKTKEILQAVSIPLSADDLNVEAKKVTNAD